jgi:hypothetical protein
MNNIRAPIKRCFGRESRYSMVNKDDPPSKVEAIGNPDVPVQQKETPPNESSWGFVRKLVKKMSGKALKAKYKIGSVEASPPGLEINLKTMEKQQNTHDPFLEWRFSDSKTAAGSGSFISVDEHRKEKSKAESRRNTEESHRDSDNSSCWESKLIDSYKSAPE